MVLVKLPGKKKVRNETQMRKLSDSTVMTKSADILNWSFFFSLWSNESVYCLLSNSGKGSFVGEV